MMSLVVGVPVVLSIMAGVIKFPLSSVGIVISRRPVLIIVMSRVFLPLLSLILLRYLLHESGKILILLIPMEIFLILELVDELAVSIMRGQLSELKVIVGLTLLCISQGRICLSELHKLLLSLSVFRSVLRMVLETPLSVSSINVLEASISLDIQKLIEVLLSVGIVLLKEGLFLLFNTCMPEEPIKGLQSLILVVLAASQLVVVVTTRGIRQH